MRHDESTLADWHSSKAYISFAMSRAAARRCSAMVDPHFSSTQWRV